MNKNLIFIGLVSFFILLSCKESPQQQEANEKPALTTQNITQEDISKLKYTEYILDRQTQATIEQWQKYTELENVIDDVKQADFSFFIENTDILLALLKDLKETTPKQINTSAVQARLRAMETVFLKFEDQLMRANANQETLIQAVKEVLVSFSNLNLQINKKFEKEAQNIEKP